MIKKACLFSHGHAFFLRFDIATIAGKVLFGLKILDIELQTRMSWWILRMGAPGKTPKKTTRNDIQMTKNDTEKAQNDIKRTCFLESRKVKGERRIQELMNWNSPFLSDSSTALGMTTFDIEGVKRIDLVSFIFAPVLPLKALLNFSPSKKV